MRTSILGVIQQINGHVQWPLYRRTSKLSHRLVYLIVVNIATKIQLLLPRFSSDDYVLYTNHLITSQILLQIQDGRFATATLMWIYDWFAVTLFSASIYNTIIHWIVIPYVAALLAERLNLDHPRDWWVFTILMTMNPFLLENVLFNGYSGGSSLALCAAILAAILIDKESTYATLIVSAVLCVMSLSLYQPNIIFFTSHVALF